MAAKDIDFDELDRAVSSIMGNNKPPQEGDGAITIDSTLDDGQRPVFGDYSQAPLQRPMSTTSRDEVAPKDTNNADPSADKTGGDIPSFARMGVARHESSDSAESASEQPAQEPTGQEKTTSEEEAPKEASVAKVIKRKSGRFMDVKHASSDMQTPAPSVSRHKRVITPVPDDTNTEQAAVPANDIAPAQSERSQNDITSTPVQATPESEQTQSTVTQDTLQEPQASPFLSDAAITKRPLGRHDETVAPSDIDEINSEDTTKPAVTPTQDPAADDAASHDMIANAAALPEELQAELLSIESDATDVASANEDAPEAAASVKKSQSDRSSEPVRSTKAAPSTPTAPVSIPQQYKETPENTEPKNGSIYDVETYHKPVSYPAKKKSGWLWVLWIGLIVVIGAVGGGALYYFKLV